MDMEVETKNVTLDTIQRLIIDNMSGSVVVLDRDLVIRYINPSCEMLFEVSRRKANGKSWEQIILGNDVLLHRLQASIKQGHPFTEREVVLHLAGDRELTVDCSVTPLYEPSVDMCLLIELQYMERQLQISREENLISQNEAGRVLLRGLAHEVKNPLGGIRGAAQLLQSELTEELREYTQIIIEEADRLKELVDRMLGPKSLPNKRLINIHEVVERVYNLINVEAPQTINIKRDYDPSIPDINVDQDQIIQATLNLARNAVQALKDEGSLIIRTRSKRQFTIGHQRYKLVIMIEIIDDGPGIPEDLQDKIFLPMVTGRAEGTGLGLSIAQSLINRHGGIVECDSKPGKTSFKILLPLEKDNG